MYMSEQYLGFFFIGPEFGSFLELQATHYYVCMLPKLQTIPCWELASLSVSLETGDSDLHQRLEEQMLTIERLEREASKRKQKLDQVEAAAREYSQ